METKITQQKTIIDVTNSPIHKVIEYNNKISKKLTSPLSKIPDPFAKFRPLLNKINELNKEYENERNAVVNNLYVIGLEEDIKDLEYQLNEHASELNDLKKRIEKVSKELGGIAGMITPPAETRKVLYVDDAVISWERIEIAMQTGLNNLLFENSVRTQWINVFNGIRPTMPIQLKESTTIKVFCYFLDKLAENEVIRKHYTAILGNLQAFEKDGKAITAQQLKNARKDYKKYGITKSIELENALDNCFSLFRN